MILAAMDSAGVWAPSSKQAGTAATRGSQSSGRSDWASWASRSSTGHGTGGGSAAVRASSARPTSSRRGSDGHAALSPGLQDFLTSDDAKNRIGMLQQLEHEVVADLGPAGGQLPFLGLGASAMFGSNDPRVLMRMLHELGQWAFLTRQKTAGQTGAVKALQGMQQVLKDFRVKWFGFPRGWIILDAIRARQVILGRGALRLMTQEMGTHRRWTPSSHTPRHPLGSRNTAPCC